MPYDAAVRVIGRLDNADQVALTEPRTKLIGERLNREVGEPGAEAKPEEFLG